MSNLVGKTLLNRYHVREFLGRGGMAEVYKVWDNQRSSFLAMKMLHEKFTQKSEVLEHFRREAENLSKLTHPNIVRFYGFEHDQHRSYILMDYIEGQTLKDRIANQKGIPFQVGEISKLLSPILVALQYAHNQDLIHCDIKPGNIMIDKTGKILLTDFGIARTSYINNHITSSSGTPAYMAPEQILGEALVPETDIYALGVVLFEMLAGGQRPFDGSRAQIDGSNDYKIRWEQLNLNPPSPLSWNPSLHPDLMVILNTALSKQTSQRYHSAIDLSNALNSAKGLPAPKSQPATYQPEQSQSTHIQIAATSWELPANKSGSDLGTKDVPQASRKTWLWLAGMLFVMVMAIVFTVVFLPGIESPSPANGNSNKAIAPTERMVTADAPVFATHTPFAPFVALPYDKNRDADSILIHSNSVQGLMSPGHTTGEFILQFGKKARITFGWCAAEQKILKENLSHIREEVTIDGKAISLRSFDIVDSQVGVLWCKSYTAVVSGLSLGSHVFVHSQYVDAEINDGSASFPAGSYITEYLITVR